MPLRFLSSWIKQTSFFGMVAVLAVSAWSQDSMPTPAPQQPTVQAPPPQEFVMKDYSTPRSHFPNPLRPYMPQHVPPPNVSNTSRIDQLMHDGKIMLSIDDAVALALARMDWSVLHWVSAAPLRVSIRSSPATCNGIMPTQLQAVCSPVCRCLPKIRRLTISPTLRGCSRAQICQLGLTTTALRLMGRLQTTAH